MNRLFREPFVHFVLIGLVVFAGHAVWQARAQRAENTIHVSLAEIERLTGIWASESGRLPSEEEIAGLVRDYVREEALYREAQRLGLDRDDTIVRRRLAQKMRFMLDDTSEVAEPDEATLRAAFDAAPERYATDDTLSFSHVYLSPEVHGEAIEADAAALLDRLQTDGTDWRTLGDAFMMPRQYGDLSETDLTRLFGKSFSDEVFARARTSENHVWIGPVGSAFGLHLVRIESRKAGKAADFSAVREQVLDDYMTAAREQANEAALAKVVARYKVEIEGLE